MTPDSNLITHQLEYAELLVTRFQLTIVDEAHND